MDKYRSIEILTDEISEEISKNILGLQAIFNSHMQKITELKSFGFKYTYLISLLNSKLSEEQQISYKHFLMIMSRHKRNLAKESTHIKSKNRKNSFEEISRKTNSFSSISDSKRVMHDPTATLKKFEEEYK